MPSISSILSALAVVVLSITATTADASPLPAAASSNTGTSPVPRRISGFEGLFKTCLFPRTRKEWRKLTDAQKKDYIDAVKCLQSLPSKSDPEKIPGARTRYDDFHGVHITESAGLLEGTGGIHLVGHFLPWHRYFIHSYETALREECNYRGAHPYWNWMLDSTNASTLLSSPIFDATTGFGGNGAPAPTPNDTFSMTHLPGGTGNGCVTSGPFANLTLHLGPGSNVGYNPRCLSRSLNPTVAATYLTPPNLTPLWSARTYLEFATLVEGDQKVGLPPVITFHGAGHYVLGGEANDFISSNADPTFYLHHAFVDALWMRWQGMDPSGGRRYEVAGPRRPFDTSVGREEVTLGFRLGGNAVAREVSVGEVVDVGVGNQGGVACYRYEF